MMKKLFAMILLLAVCLCYGGALAADQRVYDRADLFTAAEEAQLETEIAAFQQKTEVDFVILTSDEAHGDASQQQIATQFYDRGGFGLDAENSGVIYYIDMYERYHYLVATGKMIDYMTGDRVDDAIEGCTRYLSSGAYATAASRMLGIVDGYIKAGIPEGQYRYDLVTGERLTARHKALTSGEMLGSAVIAVIVALIFMAIVKGRYKLKGSTYHYDYASNCDVKLTGKEDNYLRTTTTQVRKPDPPKNDGGGFGGGGGHGGGSGVFTSGGVSHTGGGGRF